MCGHRQECLLQLRFIILILATVMTRHWNLMICTHFYLFSPQTWKKKCCVMVITLAVIIQWRLHFIQIGGAATNGLLWPLLHLCLVKTSQEFKAAKANLQLWSTQWHGSARWTSIKYNDLNQHELCACFWLWNTNITSKCALRAEKHKKHDVNWKHSLSTVVFLTSIVKIQSSW